jgi:signal transduction histidine kinase
MLSGLIAGTVGYTLFYFGADYIERVCDDQSVNRTWQERYMEDLQNYVDDRGITADNIDELRNWTDENTYVYVSVYQNQHIIFNSDYVYADAAELEDSYALEGVAETEDEGETDSTTSENDVAITESPEETDNVATTEVVYDTSSDTISGTDEEDYDYMTMELAESDIEDSEYLYRLVLADDSVARVDMFCYDYWKYHYYVCAVAVVIGIFLFVVLLTRLIQKKIRYINEIAKELQILEGGNLEYSVTVKGEDEISDLARGIEQMRLSVVENMEKEQQLLQVNKDLVTSMSHDLRTPLTTLMGYLEMLEKNPSVDEEKRRRYVELSLAKSKEIKNLSDDLFEYFLIYGEDKGNIEVEPVPAFALAEDLIGNQLLSLEEEGYQIEGLNNISEEDGNCMINNQYMQRVLNNIISNLGKYADKEVPVEVSANIEQNYMVIRVRNGINRHLEQHESTKIGLITCRRIMALHQGDFQKYETEDEFTVKLAIPMEKK